MRKQSFLAAFAAAALLGFAAPAAAGPPWISVELPSNPHHPSTRDAAFLVHAYHHSEAIAVPVNVTLEGLVNGKRRSVALEVSATNRPGVYAVRGKMPKEGTWIAVATLGESSNSMAHALIRLDREGRVASVDVPSDPSRDGWTVPRPLRSGEVDTALRAAAQLAAGEAWLQRGTALAGFGVVGVLVLLGVGRTRRSA